MRKIELNKPLTPKQLYKIAHNPGITIIISEKAKNRIKESRDSLKQALDNNERVYGVNTGLGGLDNYKLDGGAEPDNNRIRAHAVSTTPYYGIVETRAILLKKINTFIQGYSGVSLTLVKRLCALINADALPKIRRRGNTDNAGTMADMALVLRGEGKVHGEWKSARRMLERIGLEPYHADRRESLAMITGTPISTAIMVLQIARVRKLILMADLACAFTAYLLNYDTGTFDKQIGEARSIDGHRESTRAIRTILPDVDGTEQAPFSVRCAPQIHGTLRRVYKQGYDIVKQELEGVSDNPLICPDGSVLSNGTFNGQHLAGAMDRISNELIKSAHASEKRFDKLLSGERDLPVQLTDNPGEETGLVRLHYSITSFIKEAEIINDPSRYNFATGGGREDVHSLMNLSAHRLKRSVDALRRSLCGELLGFLRATKFEDEELIGTAQEFYNKATEKIGSIDGEQEWGKRTDELSEFVKGKFILSFAKQYSLPTPLFE